MDDNFFHIPGLDNVSYIYSCTSFFVQVNSVLDPPKKSIALPGASLGFKLAKLSLQGIKQGSREFVVWSVSKAQEINRIETKK